MFCVHWKLSSLAIIDKILIQVDSVHNSSEIFSMELYSSCGDGVTALWRVFLYLFKNISLHSVYYQLDFDLGNMNKS